MHYWNKANFKGLKEIAEALRHKSGYEGYARYCLLREKGLKKEALVELRSFIDQSHTLPVDEQRAMASELAEMYFYNRDIHQFFPQPAAAYVGDVLQKWCDESPRSPEPYRWSGVVCGNSELFERALREDPEDEISLSRLVLQELQSVDFATHHLSESVFLGPESEADEALVKAVAYAMRLPVNELKTRHMEEIAYYRSLLSAWREYRGGSRQKPFPEWSAEHGHKFSFGSVVYYGGSQT